MRVSPSVCAARLHTASPGVEFDLNMSFPRKKLEDKSQTVEAAQVPPLPAACAQFSLHPPCIVRHYARLSHEARNATRLDVW